MNMSFALAALALVPQPQKVVEKGGTTDKVAVTKVADATIAPEGYRLKVTADGVTVWSSDAAGAFYAQETLRQLKGPKGELPLVEIEDAPRYRWRGVHFDDCRHFFGKETLKKTLDVMAQHKLNILHWHLTEDQGWRLDIPGHPELVKYGAVRPQSVRHGCFAWTGDKEDADKLNGTPYGPFYYTEKDVKEILAYAAERHIKVIPEIELPGHAQALLAAHPEFACKPENVAARAPRIVWGISKDVLCLGNDDAIRLYEEILDYVCKVFPSDVVHIGGDECPQDRWKTCPKCQARIKKEGLKDEHGLQPWVTRHFIDFLAKRGKRTVGWDEYLLGDVPPNAIGMRWRVEGGGAGHECKTAREWIEKGHDMVMTPYTHCYLDYAQGLKDDPFQYIGGGLPLKQVYSLDPCEGVPENLRAHVLGGQGNNWSEYTWNECDLAWKMWPRMCALAEVFWTGETRPGYDDFKSRMNTHRGRLIAQNVNCAPVE